MNKKAKFLFVMVLTFLFSCKMKQLQENNITVLQKKNVNYIPYYLKIYQADSLYLANNLEESYKILDSLFSQYEPLNTEKYKEFETYISCCYKLKKNVDLRKLFEKSIEFYGTNARYIKYDSLLEMAFRQSNFNQFEISDLTKRYRDKLNFKLRDSIIDICKKDQYYRRVGDYGKNMNIFDSINKVKLREIFSKYDYPYEKLIGEFYIDSLDVDLSFVFLHTESKFRNSFLLPKVLIAVKKGLAYPELYAQSYDRYLEDYNGGKQLYGSYNLQRDKKNTELINNKKIDSIRSSIGLPHLGYYRWRIKKKYGIDPY